MASNLLLKVAKELRNHTKYIARVLERLEDADDDDEPFATTRAYEAYTADLIKGIEMISILLDSNLYH